MPQEYIPDRDAQYCYSIITKRTGAGVTIPFYSHAALPSPHKIRYRAPNIPGAFLRRIFELSLSKLCGRSAPFNYQVNSVRSPRDSYSVTMAPKKSKKSSDNINARLALVMKSGKGTLLHISGC